VTEPADASTAATSEAATAERLAPLVYQELRRIARRERLHLSGGETLSTTALINEAFVNLAGAGFESRGHFLRYAAVAMRNVLIDRARMQLAAKRGSGVKPLELDEATDFVVVEDERLVHVHEALGRLAQLNERLAQVVECRFFAGYDEVETAEALGTSRRTVQRDWVMARAWLKRELEGV
jgi:RNA polymerase sigma factor (TIGR02999 family)